MTARQRRGHGEAAGRDGSRAPPAVCGSRAAAGRAPPAAGRWVWRFASCGREQAVSAARAVAAGRAPAASAARAGGSRVAPATLRRQTDRQTARGGEEEERTNAREV